MVIMLFVFKGVGMIVVVIVIIFAVVKDEIFMLVSIGYNIDIKIIVKFDVLGIISDIKFLIKKIIGINNDLCLIFINGFIKKLIVI